MEDGDARNIWKDQTPADVTRRLQTLSVGDQISNMIVGALLDTEQIDGSGHDVKVGIHVRRVLERVLRGEKYKSNEGLLVTKKTREMHPAAPWLLDGPLYSLGKCCRASKPDCEKCYLHKEYAYYIQKHIK